ncbi:MAG: hypothetical protein JOZ81_34570 [Chloroflexi bacterium]|nr:hypothetical protein [Chloroflexota bacterium]MBV9544602.1 hypothetical protein [Chloroflexota bacterium]
MTLSPGLGGWRGLVGVVAIAVVIGLAYASLVATVLSQWFPAAGTITGIVALGAAAALLMLIWLLGAVLR